MSGSSFWDGFGVDSNERWQPSMLPTQFLLPPATTFWKPPPAELNRLWSYRPGWAEHDR